MKGGGRLVEVEGYGKYPVDIFNHYTHNFAKNGMAKKNDNDRMDDKIN